MQFAIFLVSKSQEAYYFSFFLRFFNTFFFSIRVTKLNFITVFLYIAPHLISSLTRAQPKIKKSPFCFAIKEIMFSIFIGQHHKASLFQVIFIIRVHIWWKRSEKRLLHFGATSPSDKRWLLQVSHPEKILGYYRLVNRGKVSIWTFYFIALIEQLAMSARRNFVNG